MAKRSHQSSRASARQALSRSSSSSSLPPPVRRQLKELEDRFPLYSVIPNSQADRKDAVSNDQVGEDSIIHALYFGLEYSDSQKRILDLKTVHTTVGRYKAIVQMVDFRSEFSFDFGADELYISLVVFQHRRYVVAGTYDKTMAEHNMSLRSIGCSAHYKGDIAICFYGQVQQSRILRGMPQLSRDGSMSQGDVLRRVVNAFVTNVKEHVENSLPFKRVKCSTPNHASIRPSSFSGTASPTYLQFPHNAASHAPSPANPSTPPQGPSSQNSSSHSPHSSSPATPITETSSSPFNHYPRPGLLTRSISTSSTHSVSSKKSTPTAPDGIHAPAPRLPANTNASNDTAASPPIVPAVAVSTPGGTPIVKNRFIQTLEGKTQSAWDALIHGSFP
ncbi:hypothetical protein F5878DRAFT_663613 [Lentinula raphanica]|uniref:Uncharacterized protein n=1 Tax=Lentinula raphanica TaxID=153919 RepID=A0AA38UBI4_9AGAR|nr:hypothetical protein F5878DRAFT_663613 [Lentinula raphanica]